MINFDSKFIFFAKSWKETFKENHEFKWIAKSDDVIIENNGKTLKLIENSSYVTNIESKKVLVYGTKSIEEDKQKNELSKKEYKWKIRIDKSTYVIFGFIRSDQQYNWNSEIYDEFSSIICNTK